MAECKDCIHFCVCSPYTAPNESYPETDGCGCFKPAAEVKSKNSKGCEYCKGRAYTKKPLTVITKYGRRIELVFEFCPNCGRKMKGGAE